MQKLTLDVAEYRNLNSEHSSEQAKFYSTVLLSFYMQSLTTYLTPKVFHQMLFDKKCFL